MHGPSAEHVQSVFGRLSAAAAAAAAAELTEHGSTWRRDAARDMTDAVWGRVV